MAVTIKDVAKEAGVSISTVSKVMNHNPAISPPTVQKVMDAIKLLRYEPNTQARNFVRQKTNHIIFLFRREPHIAFHNPHMFEIMTGVEEVLSTKDYTMSIRTLPSDDKAPEFLHTVIAQKSADGIIIHGSLATKSLTKMLLDSCFPYLIIGKPNFITQVSWIDTNNYLSGQLCGEYLIKKGYRNIAFSGGLRSDNIFKQRLYGFLQAIREAGITLPQHYIKYGESTQETGYAFATELLNADDKPDVIICENNYVAMGVQDAIHKQGLKIPDDIAYICFDEFPLARTMSPRPVIVDTDMYDLGQQAGKLLMQRLQDPTIQIQTHSTKPYILE